MGIKTINCYFLNSIAQASEGDGIRFGELGRLYAFKTCLDVVKGDFVVVECSAGMTVVKVDSVDSRQLAKATKWAFQKVDVELIAKLQGIELEREKLIATLKSKALRRKEVEIFAELAASDPDAKAALDRLNEIDSAFNFTQIS